MTPVVIAGVLGIGEARAGGQFGRIKLPAAFFEFGNFLRAGRIESTRANEFDNPAQLIFVEPGTMSFADIHDDVRAAGEIDAIHQLVAHRTRQISNMLLDSARRGIREGGGHAEHSGLFFAVGANLPERSRVGPDAFATRAFPQVGDADDDRLQMNATARAKLARAGFDFGAISARAAMGAEFCAQEHNAKAGGTGNGREPSAAVFAKGRVARGGRPAHGAVESFGGHV